MILISIKREKLDKKPSVGISHLGGPIFGHPVPERLRLAVDEEWVHLLVRGLLARDNTRCDHRS